MIAGLVLNKLTVNCRVGSLEIIVDDVDGMAVVNCRVGSLEMSGIWNDSKRRVNCRVGSLERYKSKGL